MTDMRKLQRKVMYKTAIYVVVTGILGFVSIFIGVFLASFRENHKILFGILYIGFAWVIKKIVMEVNPLDRFYYNKQAIQLWGQAYHKVRTAYTWIFIIVILLYGFLYSYLPVLLRLMDGLPEIFNFILGTSGLRLVISSSLIFSIPIHLLVAIYFYLGRSYKDRQIMTISKLEEQRAGQQREMAEQRAAQQRTIAEEQAMLRKKAEEQRKRQQDELEEKSRRIMKTKTQLWNYLVNEGGVASWVHNIMFGNIDIQNIEDFPIDDTVTYGFDLLDFQIHTLGPQKKWLQNSERVAWIKDFIAKTEKLFQSVTVTQTQISISSKAAVGLADVHLGSSRRLHCGSEDNIYGGAWNQRIDVLVRKLDEIVSTRIAYYKSQCRIAEIGNDGEMAVRRVLDMHPGAFIPLHNIRLEFESRDGKRISIETDTLILAPNGIFAIEVKNYGSTGRYKIVVAPDGNWYKEFPQKGDLASGAAFKGKIETVRQPLESAFAQNSLHIGGLELIINEILGRDMINRVYVENVVVIANNEVEIESSLLGRQILTRVGTLYDCLTQNRERLFTMEDLELIREELEKRNLPPKRYPINDYWQELQGIVSVWRQIEEERNKVEQSVSQFIAEYKKLT